MKIAVVGTGYVGLVTGTCFAEKGYSVACIDNDERKVQTLRAGGIPIYEPGLEDMVKAGVAAKKLTFTTSAAEGLNGADLVFIAVGTPQSASGAADLSYVMGVADTIAPLLTPNQLVVIKSTVPVGTNRRVADRIATLRKGSPVEVVSNPEFLKEGVAIADCMQPDRVVVGVRNEATGKTMAKLYEPFLADANRFLCMSPESAEMTKYAANAMLAMRISFINEISNLCDRTGADVREVREGIGTDSRIGKQFLLPGPGYGGSCFPKDVSALVYLFDQAGLTATLLQAVEQVNWSQKQMLTRKVRKHFGEKLAGRTIAVWGLAFKPHTDDIREAPSLVLLENLLNADVSVRAHDPEATANVKKLFESKPARIRERLTFADDPMAALDGADALVIVTEWPQYRPGGASGRAEPALLAEIGRRLRSKVVFDGRNVFDTKAAREAGFVYYPVGRPG